MLKKNALLRAVVAASLTTGLAACGGGSSSSDGGGGTSDGGNDTAQISSGTGQFLDSAVEGLRYVGDKGSSGLTNNNGEFSYKSAETIRFYIGEKTLLGTASGSKTVTPADLLESRFGNLDRKTNLLRLLQTSDADGDPSNGIEIPTVVGATLDKEELDLEQDAKSFESSAAVGSLLKSLSRTSLVTADQAEAHFQIVLDARGNTPGFTDGASWQSVETFNVCPGLSGTATVTFANGQVSIQGEEVEREPNGKFNADGYALYDCSTQPINIEVTESEWSMAFCSLSSCNTDAAVNGSREDSDSDGRLYLNSISGVPVVKRTVKFRDDSGEFNDFIRYQTLTKLTDTGELPEIDLTGAWDVRGYESICPNIESQSTITFTATGIKGILEGTNTRSDGTCFLTTETLDSDYADTPDFLEFGPVYSHGELNREYPDPDGNGHRVYVTYDDATDTVRRIKVRSASNYSTSIYSKAN